MRKLLEVPFGHADKFDGTVARLGNRFLQQLLLFFAGGLVLLGRYSDREYRKYV